MVCGVKFFGINWIGTYSGKSLHRTQEQLVHRVACLWASGCGQRNHLLHIVIVKPENKQNESEMAKKMEF